MKKEKVKNNRIILSKKDISLILKRDGEKNKNKSKSKGKGE